MISRHNEVIGGKQGSDLGHDRTDKDAVKHPSRPSTRVNQDPEHVRNAEQHEGRAGAFMRRSARLPVPIGYAPSGAVCADPSVP
jgi:hypothetical protein